MNDKYITEASMFEEQKALDKIAKHEGKEVPHLCAVGELTEALNHLGCETHKKVVIDPDQALLELVDCHKYLMKSINMKGEDNTPHNNESRLFTELFHIISDIYYGRYPKAIDSIYNIADTHFDYSQQDFFKLSKLKNILVKFRLDNGYKKGTYIKNWGQFGEEDNIFIFRAMKQGISIEDFYDYLTHTYKKLNHL